MESMEPMMTCYKTVTIHCKIFGLQAKLENLIMNGYRDMFFEFHQEMWQWLEKWHHLSLTDILELEKESKNQLAKKMGLQSNTQW